MTEWQFVSKVCLSTSINFRSGKWEMSYAAYYLGLVSASCLMFVLRSFASDTISVTRKPLRDVWGNISGMLERCRCSEQ